MSRDTSFYYSFLVLPQRKRHAIIAVWDFCRAVDDAVDEVVPEDEWQGGLTAAAREQASRQIAGWRRELAAIYGGVPQSPQGQALQPFVGEFGLPRTQFEALIDEELAKANDAVGRGVKADQYYEQEIIAKGQTQLAAP